MISEVRKAKYNYDRTLELKLTNETFNSKQWWHVVKTFFKQDCKQSSQPPLESNGAFISDDKEIAELFNNYFTAQATVTDPEKELPTLRLSDVLMEDIHILPKEITDQLSSLNTSKSTGPDGINNKILKSLAVELAIPLATLFNYSLEKGVFPHLWKCANVVPIHKKDSKHECSNYRPISLTSSISKIFEKCIHKHLYNHLVDHSLITPLQSGFIPGDSTTFQLIDLHNFVSKSLDKGKEVRTVYCDISKAFDKVWHRGILAKLFAVGVRGKLYDWIASYLQSRSQRVIINNATSSEQSLLAGVPQGSVLGPLLFTVYINDIVNDITALSDYLQMIHPSTLL